MFTQVIVLLLLPSAALSQISTGSSLVNPCTSGNKMYSVKLNTALSPSWLKVYAQGPNTAGFDVGQVITDKYFSQYGIFKRTCSNCDPDFQEIYFRRLQPFYADEDYKMNIYQLIKHWYSGIDNLYGVTSAIYSTFQDAVLNTNRWQNEVLGAQDGIAFPGWSTPRGQTFPRSYSVETGIDYWYNDMSYLNVTFDKCPGICDSMPGCVAWVPFLDAGSACWFKWRLDSNTRREWSVRNTNMAVGNWNSLKPFGVKRDVEYSVWAFDPSDRALQIDLRSYGFKAPPQAFIQIETGSADFAGNITAQVTSISTTTLWYVVKFGQPKQFISPSLNTTIGVSIVLVG